MITYDDLLKTARLKDCGIGIGDQNDSSRISDSIARCLDLGLNSIRTYSSSSDLIKALSSGDVQCAVRGDLPSAEIISIIKSTFKINNLKRATLLKTPDDKMFLLAPVGIDEGISIDDKLEMVRLLADWLGMYSVSPKVAVLSGGRIGDRGRSEKIDKMLDDAEILIKRIQELGIEVSNYGILIEDAVSDSNILLAPDGVIGNYIFRTLYHLGNGDSIGAPILNIPRTLIDTSSSKRDYSSAIVLGASYFNVRSGKKLE